MFRNRWTATFEEDIVLYTTEALAQGELVLAWRLGGVQTCRLELPKMSTERGPELPAQKPDLNRYAPPGPLPTPSAQPEPPQIWLIGFARSFRNAVQSIDRKLQGRILEAMTDIASAPVTNRGDTVKRLSGDMDGFWRYRIGDFRLSVLPDETTRTITLCDFASRGSAYD